MSVNKPPPFNCSIRFVFVANHQYKSTYHGNDSWYCAMVGKIFMKRFKVCGNLIETCHISIASLVLSLSTTSARYGPQYDYGWYFQQVEQHSRSRVNWQIDSVPEPTTDRIPQHKNYFELINWSAKHVDRTIKQLGLIAMHLLPDTQNCGLRMHRECWERFIPPPSSKETAS